MKSEKTLPNLDRRAEVQGHEGRLAALEKSRAARRAAAKQLRAQVPGVRVDFDEALGSPNFVASTRGFLAAGNDPQQVVQGFVEEHAAMFGHGPAVLAEARLARDYETPHNGMHTFVWQQELAGVRVFESTFQAHVTKRGELVNVASRLVPDAAAAAAKPAQIIDVKTAISAAGADVGETVTPAQIAENAPPEGPSRKQKFRSARLLEVSVEHVWLPIDEESLRLAWEVTFTSKSRGEMFRTLVDAENGAVLVRQCLTNYISNASYRVFTSDSPTPMSPGLATPGTTQPAEIARTLVTLEALDTTASPNGWIDDGVNETRGNNVDAHLDLNADDVADTPRPQGSPSRVFDFALDLTQVPSTYQNAAVTQLFYWNNVIHDRYYQLGFTEAAGNFQLNNFGRGGTGNDAVQADAQDGSGTNNANFSTPADGSPGRMQMYVFTGPTPDRDGDFDQEIVIHEYTHGLSNRLVGGGVGISALQPRGMGEGWSDFYALCLLSQPADDPNGTYAAGAYASYQLSGLTQNYYYGIRRYPYCTDLAKNPLTFKDIDPTQASTHTGVSKSPIAGSTAEEVHNQGEVWCVTLWDARANLIATLGAAAGNNLILQLVTDGMKLAPANPNFLQARDGIIQADLVNNSGANFGELWTAFAKRGMGSNATSPASSTTTGLVENYDLPDDLAIAPAAVWSVTGTIGGPFAATNAYTLVNSGAAPLDWTAAKTQPWLALSATSGTLAAGASTTVTASFSAAAASLVSGNYADTISFTNTTSSLAQQRAVALVVEPITVPIATEDWESGSAGAAWAITGTNTHRTLVTTANAPHGGSSHLTMDSSTDATYARNEATWTVDLAGRSHVLLRFWVKMFSDEPDGPPASPFTGGADFDGVAISADGTNWYEIQPLRTLSGPWERFSIDLDAASAAVGLAYNSAFKIRFNHYDNYGISTDGFAFDDIELVEAFDRSLAVAVPAAANENAGTLSGTVTSTPSPASDLTVALTSSAPGEASVPASVVILAGQASATFPITITDDALLDGTQTVAIAATALTYVTGTGTIAVQDNETAALTLSVPPTAAEGDAPLTGTVSVGAAVDVDVAVSLASSDVAELQVPASATIPAGQTSATFPVTIIDDTRIDGTVTTTISAQVTNWTGASASVAIADNETLALTVALPASVREGDGAKTGTVSIPGTLTTALTIALSSDDTSELTVPASATIAAGQTSATFTTTVQDDSLADGAQTANVNASAAGFADNSATVSVEDNDVDHFAFSAVPSPQIPNAPFAVSVTACDVNGQTITNYASTATLTAAGTGGALAVSPATLSGWVNGVQTVNATLAAADTNVVLTASDGQGHTGVSNAFDVAVGPVHHFAWSTIASPQTIDNFFPATITAQDAGNNPATSFSGTANLQVAIANSATIDVGAGVTTWDYPMHTANHDARVTSIYLASELGGARRIFSLALYVTTLPGQTMNAWTIRMKHSSLTTFPGPSWEGTGWTTVYQANQTIAQTGWVTFQFATPFDYDGTSSLMIDFCHNNATASTSGSVRNTSTSGIRSMYYATNSLYGDPLTWSGSSAPASPGLSVPNVRLGYDTAPTLVAANPPVSGSFVNGSWTGNVAVPFTGTGLRLVAEDGAGHAGESNAFAVQAPAALPGTSTTVFSEPFEDATLGAWWTITGTNNYRTQLTAANTPHGGAKHLTMDASVSGVLSRNEATLTVNLAGRTGVSMSFWAKEFGDEPHGPPTIPFTGGAEFDGVAISADGTTWYEVQALRTLTSSYAQLTVNLDAAIATHGLSYNSTFKIRFNQYDDFPITSDGIAIDDIVITAAQTPSATVTVPAQAAENAGALTGTVSFGSAVGADTVVALASNATARVAVPASVTVPAGQSSATFALTVLDNALLDGNRSVGIIATPPDNIPAGASILIVDDDVGTLALSVPATTTEGATGVTGTATLATAPAGTLTFALASSDTTEVTVPATISFAPGQTSVSFAVTIVNDTLIDGAQNATITASATGWTSASASIAVLDNENTNLTLTLPASAREGDAPAVGSVAISGSLASDLVVTLASDDPSEVTVPATITISAGQTSAAFSATIVDDTELDGAQTATITASATGFTSTSRAITIVDNDVHHFVLSAVPSPQFRDAAFTVIVTAKDVNDLTMTGYTGPASLAAAAGGNSVAVAPATLSTFVNGVWTGAVTVTSVATGVALTVGSAGHIGTSNAFDVIQPDDSYPESWATFGNGPSHTGYQPVALGTGSYQAGWTTTIASGAGVNQVAISNGRIFATSYSYPYVNFLSALDVSTGAELWRKSFTSAFSINPPTVSRGKVYTQRCNNSGDSQLWCLDAISGGTTWSATFAAQWEHYFAPTVVNDGVWVDGGTFGGLYGFNTNNGSQRFFNSTLGQYDQWTPAYYFGTIYTWVAGVFRAHDPMAGTILWSSTLSSGIAGTPVIDAGEAFVVGSANLYAIDLATHATAWTVSGTFKGTPAVANGTVFALSGSDVKAYNSQTGALVGTYATGSSAIAGQPIVTNDSLIVTSSSATYIFTLGTFTPRQTLASGGTASLANGVVYLAGSDGVLRTFRPSGMTTITVAVPAAASEGSAALTGTITLSQAAASDTAISLTSSDPARVIVPASATVAAGQTSATFQLTVVDDSLLNGSASVGITAKGPSQLFLAGSTAIIINDNETATLSVSVPASATEGVGSVTGTLTVSAAPAANIAVAMTSTDTTEATVPALVTVLAGQTTATFTITILNDTQIDGPQPATITASVPGWVSGSGTISVLDNENTNLSLSLASVTEGSTASGTVSISGTLASALVVSLSSANTARLTVPASVTIPAGSTSVSFTLTGVNNVLTDGAVTVNVTANASGFTNATSSTTVYDNDIHHFSVSSIGTSQIANVPFNVYFYAQSVENYTIYGFSGSAPLSVSAGGSSLPVTPATVSFSSGYASASVSVNGTGTGATLQISDGAGHTGTSNSFNVSIGALDHFAISTIASPQTIGTPFTATITAKDLYNNTVPTFTGTAALTAGPPAMATGTGTGSYVFILGTYTQQRNQTIYLASEVGPAGKITSLGLQAYVNSTGTIGNFTVRLKHTPLSSQSVASGWDAAGWTTVYQGSLPVAATGTVWISVPLATPFQYDGTSNLMVDITHNGTGVSGYSLATSRSTTCTLYYNGSGYADPLTWSGSSNPAPGTSTGSPNMRVQLEGVLPLTPATTGSFINGAWTGALTAGAVANTVTIRATNGSTAGESNAFTILGEPALAVSPASGLTATGNRGGPFAPSSRTWTLSNAAGGTLNWNATESVPWLDVAPASGTLASGGTVQVTATLNAAAAQLVTGHYLDSVTFTNTTNGIGNTTRGVELTVNPIGELSVTQTEDWGASGPFGGPFAPASHSYTLTNSGDAPLDWAAGTDSSWLQLAGTSGTLAPGATTTVTATINAAALEPGSYAGSISFTNTTSGRGNASRNANLEVLLPAPTLAPEPPITGTSSNTVTWSAVSGADAYEVQCSSAADFSDTVSSGWISATSHTFSGLSESTPYYYRVRAKRVLPAQTGEWTQTTEADFDTGTKTNVDTTAAGEVTLTASSEITARILNPSFENGSSDWTQTATATMAGGSNNYTTEAPIPTDGSRFYYLFTLGSSSHSPGEYARITQSVDLTNLVRLTFDARLKPASTDNNAYRAEVRIDGVTRWSATAWGNYLGQTIDLSGLPGVHTIELRGEVIAAFSGSHWAEFDNLRTFGSTDAYAALGTLTSPVIAPGALQRWGALTFTADASSSGTALSIDVLDSNENLLAAGVAPGTDLNSIAPVADMPAIRLRANLSTQDPSNTPRLEDWTVQHVAVIEQTFVSAWSSVESSVQDITAPALGVTSSTAGSAPAYALTGTSGDLSGVAAVTINGMPAVTSDGFAHWSAPATLIPGSNPFSVVAQDFAVPPNVQTLNFTVTYTPPDANGNGLPDAWEAQYGLTASDLALGDRDHDGILNILEYALGLDPTGSDGQAGCWTTTETNPADGERYLVLHYRQRVGMAGWTIDVETSSNASQWSPTTSGYEQTQPPTPIGDGTVEVIHVRVLQPIGQGGPPAAFVRLRIRAL